MSQFKLLSAIPLLSALLLSSCTLSSQSPATPQPIAPVAEEEVEEEMDEAMLEVVSLMLSAQNDSGETGQAMLTEENGRVTVTVKVMSAPADVAQPAHIHMGACPTPGDVVYPLTDVVNGVSTTTLSVTMDALMDQLPLAINVHKSAAEVSTYVACGNILQASMHMMTEDEMEDMLDDMMKDDSMMENRGMMEGTMMDDNTKEDDGMMNTGY